MNSTTSVLLKDKDREELFLRTIEKIGSQEKLAKYLSNKLNRKIIRETVKDWKKGKHTYGWSLFIPLDILKELCRVSELEYKSIIKNAVKYRPVWKDPRKKKHLIKKSRMKTIENNGKMFLDIASILPQTTLEARRSRKLLPLFAKITKNRIVLWSENAWIVSKIVLSRYIAIDELFFRACSIYFSEGVTKVNALENGKISIGNTEPDIINTFIEFIDRLLINYDARYAIQMNCKNLSYDSKTIKEFWINNIKYKINPEKIKILERKNLGSNLLHNFGTFQFIIDSTVLKPLIINIVRSSETLSLRKRDWSIEFLKGLFISEGSVRNKSGILKAVSIGAVKPRERGFIKSLLSNLDITFIEGKFDIPICGWENFCKIYSYNIFPFKEINNLSKKDKFNQGFNNLRETKKIKNLIKFKGRSFTMKDWSEKFNLKYYNSPQNTLKWFVKHGFLEKIKRDDGVFYRIKNNSIISTIDRIKDL